MENFKLGYSGGKTGEPFSDDAIPEESSVSEVRIRNGGVIDAVQIIHVDEDGARLPLDKHGGNGGELEVFTLDDDEYITGIRGRYGGLVDSLQIETNRRTSQVYGGSGGNANYIYDVPDGYEIVGFHGREKGVGFQDNPAAMIDAIGVIIREVS